jgi:hypothetical protein
MSELPSVNINSILAGWIEAERTMPSARQHDDFRAFTSWCDFYDLPMPASGEQVATYLLELLADGALLPDIKRTAKSITACYAQRRCFLDSIPIKAALALAAAQLSPNRTIN